MRKHIFITGASTGIGRACAFKLASEGHSLILSARRKDLLEKLSHELHDQFATSALSLALDVTKPHEIDEVIKKNRDTFSHLDVLINNAGLAKGFDGIQTGKLSDWDQMIDTNLKGLLYITRAILPFFLEQGSGHIVNLGSIAGRWVYPKGNVYCATKHAVKALTEAMRMDLHGSGIRVTEIQPGMVETDFSKVRFEDTEKARQVYQGMTPLTAEDIAETIAWCLSRPGHVNIQELVIYPTDQASPTQVLRKN